MKNAFLFLILAAFGLAACTGNGHTDNASVLTRGEQRAPDRFESEIQTFEAADQGEMPPVGAVLFTGSSSIRLWPALDSAFAPIPVIQRGFGGSTLPEVIYYAERIVWKYKPSVIVLYCGENDMAEGAAPPVVFQHFKRFVALMEEKLPGARLIVLSAKPSPARWQLWSDFTKYNYLIQQFAAKRENVLFVDLSPTLLSATSEPDPAFFTEDKLHLNRQGYARWKRALQPMVLDFYQKALVK